MMPVVSRAASALVCKSAIVPNRRGNLKLASTLAEQDKTKTRENSLERLGIGEKHFNYVSVEQV